MSNGRRAQPDPCNPENSPLHGIPALSTGSGISSDAFHQLNRALVVGGLARRKTDAAIAHIAVVTPFCRRRRMSLAQGLCPS